jgi:methanogenic corrinoid protein MtbC1
MFSTEMKEFGDSLFRFKQMLLSIDRLAAIEIFTLLSKEFSPIQLADKLITPALEQIGQEWERGTVALSQVYMSGRICEELLNTVLKSVPDGQKNPPNMAIGVLEDYHVLGKRIVLSVLHASGFELLDYGHGLKVDDLVNKVKNDGIKILLISTLMLRSALQVRCVREKLSKSVTDVRIVVGGAPFLFDSKLWKEVGADAMGHNASETIAIVKNMKGII